MLVEVRIHSTYKKYFDAPSFKVDVADYDDIPLYLRIHPRFEAYLKSIERQESQEDVCLVDSKFRVLDYNTKQMKKIKEGEVIYVAPMVIGGGGKRGFILIAAFAVLAVASGGFGLMGTGSGIGQVTGVAADFGTGVGGLSTAADIGGSGSIFGSIGNIFSGMPSFLRGIIGNLAISFITSLFTKKPKSPVQGSPDSAARNENNMFRSLQNSTETGTPVALNYGMTRVAGQFVSGYLHTTRHGKGKDPAVQTLFNANHSPNNPTEKAA